MGIKDQFQNKADELKERTQAAMGSAKEQASERAPQSSRQAKQRPQTPRSNDRSREEFDQDLDV
ncbi:hypothetical protein [Streptomyces sp. NPDC006879]|uniref:hypothetical protein n=1 Tax=Streptomyces sp. NPDC006879 TaxID=3364767 RepID=UPI0036B35F06